MNTINASSNNLCFQSRYLNVENPERIPKQIYYAIYQNDDIEAFLYAAKPKTLIGKFLDLFKADEELSVKYLINKDIYGNDIPSFRPTDPFCKVNSVVLTLSRKCKNQIIKKSMEVRAKQEGVKRAPGVIPMPGEHKVYKAPVVTMEDKLASRIMNVRLSDLYANLI